MSDMSAAIPNVCFSFSYEKEKQSLTTEVTAAKFQQVESRAGDLKALLRWWIDGGGALAKVIKETVGDVLACPWPRHVAYPGAAQVIEVSHSYRKKHAEHVSDIDF